MAWFRNHYRCARCGHEWSDEWSATCDDDCPNCGARHMSPYKSDDIPAPKGGRM
jgi:DNA-directed RNA polymerase subunit RPC12/RpoP